LRVDVGRLFPHTPILSDTAPAVESDARYFGGGDLCGRTEFERAVAEMPRLVAPAEQQTGARQRVIEPGERREDSARRQTLEERSLSLSRFSASLASPSCALKNFVRKPERTFSTISAPLRHAACIE